MRCPKCQHETFEMTCHYHPETFTVAAQDGFAAGENCAASTGSAEWERGYYCAVAALIRMEGLASTDVRELFRSGGDANKADECDKELFHATGLLPNDKMSH